MFKRAVVSRFGAMTLLYGASLAAQGADSGGIVLKIRDSIGAFAMVERKDYDDPGLGVHLRYQRADSLRVDVFVYPGPDFADGCAIKCAGHTLDDEIEQFRAAFPELVRRKYVDSVSVESDRALEPQPGSPWRLGRHIRLRQWRELRLEHSDLHLYYLPGLRVKLRASYRADSAAAGAIAEFARRIVPALLGIDSVAGAHTADDDERHMGVSVTLAGRQPLLFATMIAALLKQGYAIADSSVTAGRIVTAPHFGWPKGGEKESWHGSESPGVVLSISMLAKGDSTAIEIGGRSPIVADWKNPEVATQLELISVIMLAGELPDSKKKAKKP